MLARNWRPTAAAVAGLLLAAACAVAAGPGGAPPARAAATSAAPTVRPLVAAEQAFCRLAGEKGIRAAFLAWLADSSIVFRPGPVNGKAAFTAAPPRPGVLSWRPRVADIAASGDLGYTTGPWEYRAAKPTDPATGFGTYVTLWRPGANGGWQVVLDLGVEGPAPAVPLDSVPLPAGPAGAPVAAPPAEAAAPGYWMAREAQFANAFQASGPDGAYAAFLARDAVFLREGLPPVAGAAGAHAVVAARPGAWTWQPLRAHASAAGDLAYVYGTCTFRGAGWPADSTAYGNYARIWKGASIVVDVVCPAPKPAK
ncbi:MAG TPA: nuclear transport factor 2 family protein [Candidatus Saccharimonadales bacterium]|nr:nuclear transport factor 2 family protein [Candidatus Saccharimonadales bacterium]